MLKNSFSDILKRTEWFRQARFGMFIHWGLYAIPARGEWVRSSEHITVEDYQKYFDEFNPSDYNPKEWARLCKAAGMKYAVLTAKHHDGFCLFDSQYTDYKSTNTKCGRDLIREYTDAFRAEGLGVGYYYSLLDWHHDDYPKYNDGPHPMRGNEKYKDEVINFDNYVEYMHSQVRELCSNYGKIDILWFDFSYGEMSNEKWQATKLMEMVRSLQPDVIIDNRLEVSGSGFGSIVTDEPSIYSGDFVSPEQIIPPAGMLNLKGEPVPWEACITMNNNWGYAEFDKEFKSPDLIIKKLVECVSKNGNMLLNVGPDAQGRIPDESIKILTEIGKWMDKNCDSIYSCGLSDYPKPDFGRFTANGKKLYAHVMEGFIGPVCIAGISNDQIKSVRLLSSGAELPLVNTWATDNYKNYVFIGLGSNALGTYALPDKIDTVIEITLK
jgi:Alpha-L-fucosidase